VWLFKCGWLKCGWLKCIPGLELVLERYRRIGVAEDFARQLGGGLGSPSLVKYQLSEGDAERAVVANKV
jgi:hypothetical protein